MSDVIQFTNAEGLADFIGAGNSLVSGMTASEAQTALNAVENSGLYVYNYISASGAGSTIDFPSASSASEAFTDFINSGGTQAISNAATSSSANTAETANLTMIETAGGATGVAGLLSVGLPTAAAAIAPVAGVALGVGLYELNPSLWEKISRTLLPFCYDDGETIPVITDEMGNTYYPKEAIDALQQLFTEEGIGVPSGQTSDLDTSPVIKPIPVGGYGYRTLPDSRYIDDVTFSNFSNGTGCASYENSNHVQRISANNNNSVITYQKTTVRTNKNTGEVTTRTDTMTAQPYRSYTYNGLTVYYHITSDLLGGLTNLVNFVNNNAQVGALSQTVANKIAWTMVYGTPVGGYPEGTSEWSGNSYPSTPSNIMNVINNIDPSTGTVTTKPYYPVSTPIGDPGVSNDPTVNPDPTTNPEIAPAINPYISPVADPSKYPDGVTVPDPAPLENPVPSSQPVNNPNIDPSQETAQEIPENPEETGQPTNSGNSVLPTLPLVPLIPSSSDASLFHVYNPTQAQIDAFGGWLWQSWIDTLFDDLSRWFNNPMDAVIGLQQFYGTPNISGSGTIKCGYLDSHVASAIVGNRYSSINCGSIIVPEFYGNYLDYTPYTQVIVYLPFIGFMSLNADDIIGNAVNIKYHLDSYTGSCIAIITVARDGYQSTVYQYEGNCSVELPLTGGQQSTLKSALIGGISGAVIGGVAGAVVGGLHGLGTKNDVQHSGSFGASHGAMGGKVPFIVVRRPVQKKVMNYSLSYGYPAHKMVYVGNCEGYLRVREVRVMSTTATNIEKNMIVNALKQGVYVH